MNRFTLCAFCLSIGFSAELAAGQTGLIIVKSQAWSNERESDGLEYRSYVNHTGYWTVTLPNGTETQVESGTIVAPILYKAPDAFPEITTEDDVKAVASQIDLLRGYMEKYPKIRKFLSPRGAKLEAEIALYRSGKKKHLGVWYTQGDYASLNQQEGLKITENQNRSKDVAKASLQTGGKVTPAAQGSAIETRITFKTNSGVWYRNVKVLNNYGRGISVEVNEGISHIDFSDLPQNIQMQFQDNPDQSKKLSR